jgi:hypothetical protein
VLHLQQLRQQHRLRLSSAVRAGLATLVALLAFAAPAGASVRCGYSGAPAYELRIAPYEDRRIDLDSAVATVRRQGSRLVVLSGISGKADCSGPPATVLNTDRIRFVQAGLSFAELDLAGGPLGPGKTAESDGSNEIEVVFRATANSLAYGLIVGTKAADAWTITGSTYEPQVVLDPLRPTEPDVFYTGPGVPVITAEARDGNDLVDATAMADREAVTILSGGPGRDELLGSGFGDLLDGGRGRDLLEGGAGRDELRDRDRNPDQLDCGADKDRAVTDKGDSTEGCEKVVTPRR